MMLSVIVPVYNVQKYLDQCVQSVLEQTFADFELILVDDGSTDDSLAKCQLWAEKDSRVKVICQENQGPSQARNNGIAAANGKYITFVDSDDMVDKEMFQLLVTEAEKENLDGVWCTCYRFFDDDINTRSARPVRDMLCVGRDEIIKEMVLDMISSDNPAFETPGTMWGGLYRREIIEKNGLQIVPFKEVGSEDNLFNIQYLPLCQKVRWINKPMVYYRKNTVSISNTIKDYTVPALKNFEKCVLEESKKWNVDQNDVKRRCKRRVINAFSVIAKTIIANNSFGNAKTQIKKYIKDNSIDTSFTMAELKNTDLQVAVFWVLLQLKMYLPLYILVKLYNRFIVK